MMLGIIIENLGESFTKTVFEAVEVTRNIALILIPIFILVEVGRTIVSFLMGGDGTGPDFQKTFVYLLLFFFTLSYVPVMRTFDGIVNSIEKAISTHPLAKDSKVDALKNVISLKYAEQIKDENETSSDVETTSSWDSFWTTVKSAWDVSFISIPAIIGSSIADGITWTIRLIVEILSLCVTGVLIIVGPLAIAFNMAPWVGEGILKNWFSAWLSIKCWIITMTVIDIILDRFIINYISTPSPMGDAESLIMETMSAGTLTITFNVVFIILYLMVPAITNYYIKGSGGALFSKMIAGATTVINSAATVATLGKAAAAQKMMQSSMSTFGKSMEGVNKSINSISKQLSSLEHKNKKEN